MGRHNNYKYKVERLKSASDLEALIMLYDEAIDALGTAKKLCEEKDEGGCKERIEWAKKIIEGFVSLLNFDVDPTLAKNLYRIYDYLLRRLDAAAFIIRQTPAIIGESIHHLSTLRDAWIEVKEKGDITEKFRLHLTTDDRSFLNIKI